MIAYISGTLHSQTEEYIVVLTGGVGYAVSVPQRVRDALSVGAAVELYTYQHVREDMLDLYGFLDQYDLQAFQRLIQVSGVGPRMALNMLSQLTALDVSRAVATRDVAQLTAISGVGKKTAERIVIDLQDSVAGWSVSVQQDTNDEQVSAIAALEALGFSSAEAREALKNVDMSLPVEEQVRFALRSSAT